MSEEEDPLAILGYSDEEIAAGEAAVIQASEKYEADYRVCICGHAARAHASQGRTEDAKALRSMGREQCRIAKVKCPCVNFTPVLTSSQIRLFTFKTTGIRFDHALQKGVKKARDSGAEIDWLIVPECIACHKQGVRLTICAVTPGQVVSSKPQPYNVFLCDEHLRAAGGAV